MNQAHDVVLHFLIYFLLSLIKIDIPEISICDIISHNRHLAYFSVSLRQEYITYQLRRRRHKETLRTGIRIGEPGAEICLV